MLLRLVNISSSFFIITLCSLTLKLQLQPACLSLTHCSPARPGVAAAAAPIPSPSRPFLKGAAMPAPAPAPAPAAAAIPGPVMPPKPPKPAAAPALPPGWEEVSVVLVSLYCTLRYGRFRCDLLLFILFMNASHSIMSNIRSHSPPQH